MTYDEYIKNPNICKNCGKPILPKEGQRISNVRQKQFCGSSCAATYNNKKYPKRKKKKIYYCKNCGKELSGRKKSYCDNKCQSAYEHNEYIKRWKDGIEDGLSGKYHLSKHIKDYIYDKYDGKCCVCGWHKVNEFTGKVPLEVHHIDGNYKNNSEDNLQLLCPSCHSLTSTYGGANRGHGRGKHRNE